MGFDQKRWAPVNRKLIYQQVQGPVVRKSVNANPGFKVKLGFDFSFIKAYIRANVLWGFTLVKGKTEGNKI